MITVVGLDGGPLGPRAAAALAQATCVAGALRHLAAVPVPAGATRVVMGDLAAALREVTGHSGPAVVLASGDPGFFGVVRALRERGVHPDVLPAVSSVALAFARIGVPWDDAVVASAHGRSGRGRSVRRALAAALAHPKAAILTAPVSAEPRAFLPALLRAGRDVYVAERLGAPDEAVVRVTDAADAERDRAHPNVVIAVDPERAVAPAAAWLPGHQGAPDGWALPEADFAHRDSMVTKAEVRAVALAHLAPRPGTVVWDVGAGSGSVAVECARFGAHAVAFERAAADCRRIRGNAAAHGVAVRVCEGEAPGVFERVAGLLAPDAVFVGGGGPGVVAAVAERFRPDRVVVALAALDRVRTVYDLLEAAGYEVAGTQLQPSRLAALPDGSLRLAATNPVTLLWGARSTAAA
ncbi:precorrin-6y C5,15-methyltransferase (decarboxylating) subunit CbiE [Marinitenerispora sediminis]|uniref:Bifunctional cobalt-precorrin-7 (C(5))-methyltransferase CbiE/decarboxylating cobalt-precorrin-6B (C(15))-methyltransferase CbiT n=1 Tax=Marinitenerispora sediminis TaxID=1931232 RepID=A0A368SZR2_9ACTN|nr:precorrin-6y C5,15-methyltransferase (decarboxylating) subunit CbiE [Marinitenerispora sediminis]RCV51830.1 bifunctional cobalt-precorrin-7 (C(5))-methyltransferase CbiE/decarboxylating cobalt-precorrin-6B (C(15))-methyltransferase CbiT [Marinitenerispora sediminis]RCV54283.1 bifunctional cobalt-precorrin-7 (C(5))-methyltransferase CbiE/decarboxylating cobalt-precorrin-6B (C(15))-methyltransferase CbiT [Marinitenerispora sediminis]RCV56429.1 bifunctional cobalt-precorrin-7 (C(5))-methyltransf